MAFFSYGKHILSRRNIFSSQRLQHGYIVLIPEIGEDLPENNPLFQKDGLPEFNHITIEHCRAAIAKQTLDFETGVRNIERNLTEESYKNVFQEIFQPLEELGTPLDMTWGLSKTLYLGNSTLMPTSSYMSIHDRARRARAAKYNSKPIYEAVKKSIGSDIKRTPEENRILEKFLLEGRLNGMELDHHKQALLNEYLNKLNKERSIFKQKTEISTKQFQHRTNDNMVTRDFPEDILKLIASDPNQPLKGPWILTLQPHIYTAVMEYCSDRQIRYNLWQALVGRGSNYRDRELATSLHLEEIVYARRDVAKLLDYETYADMSMETKMAGSVSEVKNMIMRLLERAKPAQENELQQLHEFAVERGSQSESLELWDIPYWRRKQLSTVYGYIEHKFKEYFPLTNVLEGLFHLSEKLFDVQIKQRNVSVWHRDVKFYDIFESHSSAPIAGFYLDPYARFEQKLRLPHSGWMVGIQNQSLVSNRKPLAALIFNFDPPNSNQPCCLSVSEVKVLFQRFGRALQHLLTRTNYSEVSGLSNIEWDAVEISGNLLTHWMYDKGVIDSISRHYNSEDKLPQQMFQAMCDVHKHMAGLDLCRELYLSDFDLELHSTKDFWLDIVKRLWPQYQPFTLQKIDSHPCSFTQILSEEWGAAYYSHVWSKMVAADVYSAFYEVQGDEQRILDIGKRYRDTFLALGGSVSAGQIFREFRGRDPSPKALISSLGLKKVKEIPS